MATDPAPPVQDVSPPQDFDLTLDEFCTRASTEGHGVEMLAGFHSNETRLGRLKATQAVFAQRLADFADAPAV